MFVKRLQSKAGDVCQTSAEGGSWRHHDSLTDSLQRLWMFITSIKDVMHVFTRACLSVCLRTTQKLPIKSSWNFTEWLHIIHDQRI